MKTTAFGVSCLAIVMTTLIALLQIVNLNTRSVDIQDNLQEALETSLSTAMSEHGYTIGSDDELVADVSEGVVLAVNDPHADITVQVNKVDKDLGIVSVKVTVKYPSVLNGNAQTGGAGSTVTAERTIILEPDNPAQAGQHEVTFLTPDGALYKRYLLTEDSQHLPYPSYPAGNGQTFVGWTDKATGTLYSSRDKFSVLPLDKSYTFVAVLQPR